MLNYLLIVYTSGILAIIIGLFKSHNTFSKILFLNALNTLIILYICLLGSFRLNDNYVDIALIYLLINFISTLGYLRYFLQEE